MRTSPSELGEGALALAGEQPVLPLEPAGKRPLGGLGLHHASTDRETVAGWWARWPGANIGLRCDGLFVVDVDGQQGEWSLDVLQSRYGGLPPTRAVKTGRGRHLLYRSPALELRQSTASLGRPPGIDLRSGSRGYVVAPPSVHASGSSYRWLNGLPPAPLPEGWVEPLTRVASATHAAAAPEDETAYGRAVLRRELEQLLRACDGQRNEDLNRCVFKLAQLVAGGQLHRATVEGEASAIAHILGLSPRETRITVCSAMSAGLRCPRVPRKVAG